MIKLDVLIKDLLLTKDCVIVPGFGAFVCNYHSAEIQDNQRLITPPSKSILFNASLKKSDGLLATHVAEILDCNHEKALEVINEKVNKWNTKINSDYYLELNSIGAFRLGEEDNILFDQNNETNFLADAYGLSPVHITPIKVIKKQEISDKVNQVKSNVNRKPLVKYAIAASLILPFLVGALWVSMNVKDYKNQIQELDLFNFSKQTEVKTVEYNSEVKNVTKEDVTTFFDKEELKKIEELGHINSSKDSTQEIPVIEQEQLKTIKKQSTIVNDTNFDYALIAGCFSSYENAVKFRKQLNQKGYDANFAGKSNGGLYRVAYSLHKNKEDALAQMIKLKSNPNNQVWLLNN